MRFVCLLVCLFVCLFVCFACGTSCKLYGGSAESGVGLVCTYPPLHIDIDIDVDKFDLQ